MKFLSRCVEGIGKKAGETFLLLFVLGLAGFASAAKQPPSLKESAKEPVRYVGKRQSDKRYYDGGLPHAVGVHHYQAFRANRAHPAEPGDVGWTYNHQAYLAYWNGRFYLQYLSNVIEEHNPPGRTLVMTSQDGRKWSAPVVAFPIYSLPEIVKKGETYIPAGTKSVMHQRMGFYVAPNGRLLTLAFYGYTASMRYSPNAGNGLGRVVREIYKDGSFGPIYFIRYNRHAGFDESNTSYPFYKMSKDRGFVQACEALLADKLMTLQWWEEDRGKDGFYTIDPHDVKGAFRFGLEASIMTTSKGAGKSLCYYHRPDGVVVAIWKNQWSALSPDEGRTWTPIAPSSTLMTCGAKVWGQRTEDGRYALVYNHSANRRNRFPLVVMTGEDGHEFDNMLCLQGEVPPMRYEGWAKGRGPQYIRGIVEGNGNPPGKYLWNVYDINKEDMWVTRTRVPITGTVDEYVDEDFEKAKTEADLELWNLYIPKWAPIRIVSCPGSDNKCLELGDEDPYDYALAERAFPESRNVIIKFDLMTKQIKNGRLEIDVLNKNGVRPVRVILTDTGKIQAIRGKRTVNLRAYMANTWLSFKLNVNAAAGRFTLDINGKEILKDAELAEKTDTVERVSFRTGKYRQLVSPERKGDLPNAGERVKKAVYYLDNVSVRP